MAFIHIRSAHCKALLLFSQLLLIWHGGTAVMAQSGPSPVKSVSITNRNTTSVTLSWDPPNETNSSTYIYMINVFNGSTPWSVNSSVNATSIVVTDLIPGVTYSFSVYTVTSNGIPSSEKRTIQGTTSPSPVHNVSITKQTTTAVTLSWDPPTDTNSSTYTYKINVFNDSDMWNVSRSTDATSIEETDLLPGVTYSFSVYTVTWDWIESAEVGPIQATTRPSPVQSVSITNRNTTSVTLSWDPPTDTNSSTYTYMITLFNGSTPWSVNSSANATSIVVTDLNPGVTYLFSVYTVASNETQSSENRNIQGTTSPSPVHNVSITNQTTTSVTLSWDPPTDTNSSTYTYKINVFNDSTMWNVSRSTDATSIEETDLLPGVTYSFSVYTVTWDWIESSEVGPIQATTTPNAPTNVSGNPLNTTALSINWTPPNDINEKNYTYTVNWNGNPGALNQSSTTDTTLVISNLTAGNLYNVSVFSVINNVTSVEAVTNLLTNPGIPGGFSITNITNTAVYVSWTNPSDGSFTGIEIKAESGTGSLNKDFSSPSSEGNLDGLIPGTSYNLTLRSFSSYPPTSRRNRRAAAVPIKTYSDPITRNEQTYPNAVPEITCFKVGGGYQLRVLFPCPNGSFDQFKILADGTDKETVPKQDCRKDVTIQNLQPARKYKIAVVTVANNKQASLIISCDTDNVGVIVGSIFGVLLFMLLVGLLAYFVLRKRRGLKNPFGKDSSNLEKIKTKRVPSVIKTEFSDYYQRQQADSDFGFAEEYQQLSTVGTDQSKRAAELPENRNKNRFTNVLPYDHSRVKLNQIDGNDTTDYINANYMPGFNSSKEFIASQGPMPNTSADFWRMVWENQVSTIVMLTNCMENGRVKCEHYWPLDYTPCTYGDITVTVTSETILPDWTIRDFSIKHAKQQGNKSARHFHFTVWPDHGVPENTTDIVEFRNLVREYMDQKRNSGPTVVHCSAGVGRTGTLIALDYLIQKMEKEQRIGIYGFVHKMRLNRPLMVQTESQYVFLNKCMLDLIQNPSEENIYENQISGDLIYENASVLGDYQKTISK